MTIQVHIVTRLSEIAKDPEFVGRSSGARNVEMKLQAREREIAGEVADT